MSDHTNEPDREAAVNGLIAVVVVAIATYLAFKIAERERGLKSREVF